MKVNREKSQEIAAQIGGAVPKECWRNAALASLTVEGFYYAEGWVILPIGIPIEHGWLVTDPHAPLETHEIVDPTLADDDWLDQLVYFPTLYIKPTAEKLVGVDLPIMTFRDVAHRKSYEAALDYLEQECNSG